jgi:hypothetical protein
MRDRGQDFGLSSTLLGDSDGDGVLMDVKTDEA